MFSCDLQNPKIITSRLLNIESLADLVKVYKFLLKC